MSKIELKTDKGNFQKRSLDLHERILILGRTRTGKSLFTALQLESLAKRTLVILIDTKNEYSFIESLPLTHFMNLQRGLYRINEIVYPDGYVNDDLRNICEFLCQNIFNRGNCILVVEEAGNVIKKRGELYESMPFFAKVLLQGGGKDIGVICISQRPAQIHTDVINEAEHIITFDLSGKHDLEAVKHIFNLEWFENLGKHEFFHYDVKEREIMQCYKLYPPKKKLTELKRLFGKD